MQDDVRAKFEAEVAVEDFTEDEMREYEAFRAKVKAAKESRPDGDPYWDELHRKAVEIAEDEDEFERSILEGRMIGKMATNFLFLPVKGS